MTRKFGIATATLTAWALIALVLLAAPALADEGKDESGNGQKTEAQDESQKNDESAKNEAEGERESAKNEAKGGRPSGGDGAEDGKKNDTNGQQQTAVRTGSSDDKDDGGSSGAQGAQNASGGGGTGKVEAASESTNGLCDNGTAVKIDNLRGDGTFTVNGITITISNFSQSGFDWSASAVIDEVIVKAGGDTERYPGGTSGTVSRGRVDPNISHVGFCVTGRVGPGVTEEPKEDEEVGGGVITRPAGPDRTTPRAQPEDVVLGASVNRAAPEARAQQQGAATLPFTGGAVIPMLATALALIASGFLLTRRMRARR